MVTREAAMACNDVYNQNNISVIDANILTIIYVTVFMFITLPNTILARRIYKYARKRKAFNVSKKMFFYLVLVQILFALIVLPYNIYIVRKLGGSKESMACSRSAARGFLSGFFNTLCLNLVVLLSVERYAFITDRKVHREKFSEKRTRWKVALMFIVAAAWGLAYAITIAQGNDTKLAAYYTSLVIYLGLVLLAALVYDLRILRRVALSKGTSTLSLQNKRTERKLSRTITLISTISFICYLPMLCSFAHTSYHLFRGFSQGTGGTHLKTVIWCTLPVYCNYGLTALIYLVRGGKRLSQYASIRHNNDAILFTDKMNEGRKKSTGVFMVGRKTSDQTSYQQMKKKVSIVSETCEVKGGMLVLKDAERKSRKISRQQTNYGYVEEE